MHRHSQHDSAHKAHRGAAGSGLAMLGVFVPTAYLAFKLFEKESAKTGPKRPKHFVRDAGPDNMQTPPRRWDSVDQQADESFPASDPPGNY
jgi:hypothetical protein